MTTTALRLPRHAGPPATSAWLLLPMVALGATMGAATWVGGQWPLTFVVLLLTVAAFTLVLTNPHIGISLFLTTFLINYPGVARGVGFLTINNVLGGLFLGLLAWDYYRNRDAWYLRERLVWMLLAIGGMLVLSTVSAEYGFPDAYIQRLIERPVGVSAAFDFTRRWLFQHFSRVAFVVFMLQFVRTPGQLRAVFLTLLACILAAVPPALIQWVQAGAGEFRIDVEIVNWADNENRFAFGCVLGISLLFYLLTTVRSAAVRGFALVAGLLLLPLVLLAASRSGFLGICLLAILIVGGAFGTTPGRGSAPARIAALLALTGVGFLTFTLLLDPRAQERVLNLNPFAAERLEGTASTEFRAAAVEHSLALIRQHPILGVGLGNFRWVNRYYHGFFKPPHNSYLWAAAEGGVVLLSAYLLLFRQLWRRFGRLRSAYTDHPQLAFFPHWLRVYMVLLLFFSFFADVWLEEHIFLLVGSAILLDRWRRDPVRAVVPAVAPGRRGVTIAAPPGAVVPVRP